MAEVEKDEAEKIIEEALSKMIDQNLSVLEEGIVWYDSWLKIATELALKDYDEGKIVIEDLISTMTSPSKMFCVGYLYGWTSYLTQGSLRFYSKRRKEKV